MGGCTCRGADRALAPCRAFTLLAKRIGEFLVDKPVNSETLNAGLDVLGQEFDLPYSVPGGMPSYRRTLVLSFFFKFFVEIAKEAGVVLDGVAEKDVEEATEVRALTPPPMNRTVAD